MNAPIPNSPPARYRVTITEIAGGVETEMYAKGKKLRVSSGAIISMGKAAKASDAWKARNGYTAPRLAAA